MARSIVRALFSFDQAERGSNLMRLQQERPDLEKAGSVIRRATPPIISGALAGITAALGGDAAAVLAVLGLGAWAADGTLGHLERRMGRDLALSQIEGLKAQIFKAERERDSLNEQIEDIREQGIAEIPHATILPDEPARLRERIIDLNIEAARKRREMLETCGKLIKMQERQGIIEKGDRVGGKYIRIDKLGEGGMGIVSAVYHPGMEALLVVKESVDIDRLRVEAQLTRKAQEVLKELAMQEKVSIAQVCPILDFDEANGLAVMEYIPGIDLSVVLNIARQYPLRGIPALTLREAGEIMLQLLRAFEIIHHRLGVQVIHRDLKPENVMITRWQRGKKKQDLQIGASIIDFGVGKRRDRRATMDGSLVVGTPLYMAAEQWHGSDVTYKADLYSLGIMFFELLTGRVPFEPPAGAGTSEVFKWGMYALPQLIEKGIPDITREEIGQSYPPVVTDPINEFLMATLTVNPKERGDASILKQHIEEMLAAEAQSEPTGFHFMGG